MTMQSKANHPARVDEELVEFERNLGEQDLFDYQVEELEFDEAIIMMDAGRVILRKREVSDES